MLGKIQDHQINKKGLYEHDLGREEAEPYILLFKNVLMFSLDPTQDWEKDCVGKWPW